MNLFFSSALNLIFSFVCACVLFGCASHPSSNQQTSTVCIGCDADPLTLDPRQVRDLQTATTLHLLYEGLMRLEEGGVVPGIAKEVIISPDQMTYTFRLRESQWSNGQPLTAKDFEKTWKSLLQPSFPSPNAYQFYVIKGAQAAKEGLLSVDQIGIFSEDDHTLVVQLEKPTPYFLQLTATHFFYPVSEELRGSVSDIHSLDSSNFVSNGPFKLNHWSHHNEFKVIKNETYWDQENVRLQSIVLVHSEPFLALQSFQRKELQWAGSPLSIIPTDALEDLKHKHQLHIAPTAGVSFFRLNVEKAPFNYPNIRRAFSEVIHRTDLIKHVLKGNQIPAFRLVPDSFWSEKTASKEHQTVDAKQLLLEELAKTPFQMESFPLVTISYASGERSHKIAQVAQQYIQEALNVPIELKSYETKVYFDDLKKGQYQMSIGSWFADIEDPISFLEIFKYQDNGTNNTGWQNSLYISLLEQSSNAHDAETRKKLLRDAENVLIEEMPIIPLFFPTYHFLKDPLLEAVYFSQLGFLDFKYAYFRLNE